MYNRTYFFRDEYSLYEMIERIPKENFVNLVEQYCNIKIDSKDESKKILIDKYNEEDCYDIVQPCFEQYGQKGDKLNIYLYDFKFNNFKFDPKQFNKILEPLKGKQLNDLPIIGSFCISECTLEDYRINKYNQIDFKFKYEVSMIREDNGVPISVIEDIFIECRYYIDQKIIAVVENRIREIKSALNIIFVLPYFVKLELMNSGNTIDYSTPQYDILKINATQLQLLKLIFNGKLKSTEISVAGEIGVKFKMTGDSENFENESKFYNENTDKGLCTAISFYTTTSGLNNIITIKSSGCLMSSYYASESILNKTASLIHKVDLCKDYLFTIDEITNKYCRMIRLGMPTQIKSKHKSIIIQDITTLIDDIKMKYKLNMIISNVYLTIILNIIIKLASSGTLDKNQSEIDTTCYGKLMEFMVLYASKEYKINMKSENTNHVMNSLVRIINNANNEAALINFYENNY